MYSIMFMSVKGGCGKSTLSLYSALYLSKEFGKAAYYIDTDLLASSSRKNIFGENFDFSMPPYSMTDIAISGFVSGSGDSEKVLPNYILESSIQDIDLKFLLCDSDENKREFFRGDSTNNINTVIYKGNLSKLFDKIKKHDKEAVCVIDMPPATDNYSDCLVKLLLERDCMKDRVTVCHVTTDNYAHIVENLKYIEAFYSKDEHRRIPDNIVLIINIMTDSVKTDEINKSEIAFIVYKVISDLNIKERLYVMFVDKDEKYMYNLSIANADRTQASIKKFYDEPIKVSEGTEDSENNNLEYSIIYHSISKKLLNESTKKEKTFYSIVKGTE